MADPNKFSCSVPLDNANFLECTLPNASTVETLTMLATVAAVIASLAIAVIGGMLARNRERDERKKKQKLDNRKSWDESAMKYVESIRALSNQYPKVERSVDDAHFSAFNHYAALSELPEDHRYMIAIRKVNGSIEQFLDVWVRKSLVLNYPKGVLLGGTTTLRDLFASNVQNALRDYCKLIIEWHFQPIEKRDADLLEQFEKLNTRLESSFGSISKDYLETLDTTVNDLPDAEQK